VDEDGFVKRGFLLTFLQLALRLLVSVIAVHQFQESTTKL